MAAISPGKAASGKATPALVALADAIACNLACLSWLARFACRVQRVAVMTDGHRVIIFGFLPQNFQEAVAYAQRGRGEHTDATHGWASLSPVERQVVELASQGFLQRAAHRAGIVLEEVAEDRERSVLARFRGDLYRCLTRRGDALFELADAVLCRPERVHMLAELSQEPQCRRGHGAGHGGRVGAGAAADHRTGS